MPVSTAPREQSSIDRAGQQKKTVAQNPIRQQQMQEDAAKLIALATELHTEMTTATSLAGAASVQIKKAEQIEKLAKPVEKKTKATGHL